MTRYNVAFRLLQEGCFEPELPDDARLSQHYAEDLHKEVSRDTFPDPDNLIEQIYFREIDRITAPIKEKRDKDIEEISGREVDKIVMQRRQNILR